MSYTPMHPERFLQNGREFLETVLKVSFERFPRLSLRVQGIALAKFTRVAPQKARHAKDGHAKFMDSSRIG